jgi:uncharacterized protein YbdZ (MbtH family)
MGAPFLTIVFPESGRVQPQKDDVIWRPWMGQNPTPWSDFYAATHPPIPEGWGVVKEWELRLDNVIHNGGSAFLIKSDNHNGLWHSGDGYFCKVRRTLPAIPAGWEAVGEWRYEPDASCYSYTGVARDFRGEYKTIHSDGWWLLVRRVLPAVPHGWEAVGEWHDTLSPCSEVYDWTLLQDGRIVQRGETFRRQDERIMGVHIRRVLPDVDWGDVPRDIKILPLTARALGVWRGDTQIGVAVQQDDGKWELQKMNLAGKYANQPSLPAAIVALTGRRK